jgi:hypothetical protein
VSTINRHFVRHYVEMVLAMFAGMIVLAAPAGLLIDTDPAGAMLLTMATTMTTGMVVWMRFRGHGWLPCAEMGAAMYLPTFAALGLLGAGVVGEAGALGVQHVGMLAAMFGAMLLRPAEYAGHAHHGVTA